MGNDRSNKNQEQMRREGGSSGDRSIGGEGGGVGRGGQGGGKQGQMPRKDRGGVSGERKGTGSGG